MTTTARPSGALTHRTPRVLLVAVSAVLGSVVLTVLLGGLLDGAPGANGALVGGGLATCFFALGSGTVTMATRMAPQAAMVVALMTYTLQVAAVALVFAALTGSGAIGTTLARGWLAAGVVVATLAWTTAQMAATAKARIPVYELASEAPSTSPAASPAGAGPRPREGGAS